MRSRRDFLKACCACGAAGASLRLTKLGLITAHAQGAANYKALVCVYLNGGNDGNNLVVPLSSQGYQKYAAGPALVSLPANSLLPIGVNGGTIPYGLHARMTGLQALYNQKKAALVFNVGTLVRPTTRAQYRAGQASVPKN